MPPKGLKDESGAFGTGVWPLSGRVCRTAGTLPLPPHPVPEQYSQRCHVFLDLGTTTTSQGTAAHRRLPRQAVPGLRRAVAEYFAAVDALSRRVLRLLALAAWGPCDLPSPAGFYLSCTDTRPSASLPPQMQRCWVSGGSAVPAGHGQPGSPAPQSGCPAGTSPGPASSTGPLRC